MTSLKSHQIANPISIGHAPGFTISEGSHVPRHRSKLRLVVLQGEEQGGRSRATVVVGIESSDNVPIPGRRGVSRAREAVTGIRTKWAWVRCRPRTPMATWTSRSRSSCSASRSPNRRLHLALSLSYFRPIAPSIHSFSGRDVCFLGISARFMRILCRSEVEWVFRNSPICDAVMACGLTEM